MSRACNCRCEAYNQLAAFARTRQAATSPRWDLPLKYRAKAASATVCEG